MSTEHGYSADPEHRAIFKDRRCAVATAECGGNVRVIQLGEKAPMLCHAHEMLFSEQDHAGMVDRLRAWVVARKRGGTTP
jgi:hypothetical protein